MEKVVKKMTTGKAVGVDELSVEILKPNRRDANSRTHLGPKNMQSNPRRQKEDEGIERRDWHEKKHLKMKVAGIRMRWAGHVQRMSEDRLSKRALKAEEDGRRRRGRPKLRWKDSVKRDLERAGTNGQEWKTIAEDRGRWRALTPKVEEAME